MKNTTDVIKSFCVQLVHQYDLEIKSNELKKILDKEEFSLLYCYIEKAEKLYDMFSYDTLKEYEQSFIYILKQMI